MHRLLDAVLRLFCIFKKGLFLLPHSHFKILSQNCFHNICLLGPLQELLIREFSFHQLNANLLWPGTFAFAEWLVQHQSWIEGRRSIELGRHVLLVFLKLLVFISIITSV